MPSVTLRQFAHLWTHAGTVAPRVERQALTAAGARLARTARGYLGEYQNFGGPFGSWKKLAPSTLTGGVSPTGYRYPGKIELGFAPPDNPLVRTGELRSSITFSVEGRMAVIGSTDVVARYQEFGTASTARHNAIPPRPFIGPAVYIHGWDEAIRVARRVLRPILTGRR